MRRAGKLSLGLVAVVLLVAGALTWLSATTTGARWLLARTDGLLPAQLALVEVDGSLTRGLNFDSVSWTDEGITVVARNVYVHVELLPLLQRVVRILDLDARSLDIAIEPSPATGDEPDSGPFELDLPVDILLERARVQQISFQRGEFSRRIDAIDLVADLRGRSLSVSDLQVSSDWLTLSASGESRLSEPYATDAQATWSLLFDERRFAGRLDVDGDTGGFDVSHDLSRPFSVNTDGRISFDAEQIVVDIDNRWTDVSWPFGERVVRSSEGALSLDGSLDALRIELDLLASLADVPVTSIAAAGMTDLTRLDNLELTLQNELGLLSASGNVTWSPDVSFAADFELADLDPSLAHVTLKGNVGAAGQVNGSLADGSYNIAVGLDRLMGNINDAPLDGAGRLDIRSGSLSFDTLNIALGDNRALVNGRLAERIDLSVDAQLENIGEILPASSGSMVADIDIGGSQKAPEVSASVRARRIEWSDLAVDTADLDLSIAADGRLVGELGFEELWKGEQSIATGTADINGTVTAHRLNVALRSLDSSLSVAAAGGWANGTWSGELASIELDNPLAGAWRSESAAALSASGAAVDLSSMCLARANNTGRACVEASYGNAGDVTADLLLEALPITALRLPLPDGVTTDGAVFADARARIVGGRVSGAATVELRDARAQTTIDGENYATDFSTFTARANLDDNRLEALIDVRTTNDTAIIEASLNLADIAAPDSALSGDGVLRVDDAAILASLIPDLSNLRGRIAGNVELGGRIDVPEVTGEIRLSEGAVRIRRAGIDISDIDLSLAQLSPGSLKLRGSARSGDGELTMSGDTYLGTDTGLRTELTISGEDFEILRLPDWQASASPDVNVVVDERRTLVTGEFAVPKADITVKEIPETAMSPSKDAIVHRADVTRADEVSRTLDVDLRASLGDAVRLKAFGLDTGLGGSVQLRGGSGQAWRGFGRVELADGIYKSYGQELTIERGLLIFNGPLDSPQLDIRAIREVDAITAGIHLTGTPSDLRSSVFSQPPLRDAEALSYLLTGRPLSSATSTGEGDLLGNAAFALGLSGAGLVASRVRSQLGLDSLSIEGGADDGRIIAGKRLNSRLLVEYGYGLVDRLGSLLLRYQLNERLVLESRTGATSEFDLVYRVRKQ